jgi:hypothetical protein
MIFYNIMLNNGFVMPYFMNIDEYYVFFLGNADIDLLVFLEIFFGNEGVDIASHLIVFLHSTQPYHWPSFSF